jgi:hypothetical protein
MMKCLEESCNTNSNVTVRTRCALSNGSDLTRLLWVRSPVTQPNDG